MDTDDEAPVPFGTLRPGERRALIGCAFAAGCICLMPQQLAGAAIAFVVAGALGVWHVRRSKREEQQARGATLPDPRSDSRAERSSIYPR